MTGIAGILAKEREYSFFPATVHLVSEAIVT